MAVDTAPKAQGLKPKKVTGLKHGETNKIELAHLAGHLGHLGLSLQPTGHTQPQGTPNHPTNLGSIWKALHDVVLDGAREQHWLLTNIANAPAPRAGMTLLQ